MGSILPIVLTIHKKTYLKLTHEGSDNDGVLYQNQ